MVYAGVLRSSKCTLHLATLYLENSIGPPKLEIILLAPKYKIYFKSTIKLFYFIIAKVKLSIFFSLLRVFVLLYHFFSLLLPIELSLFQSCWTLFLTKKGKYIAIASKSEKKKSFCFRDSKKCNKERMIPKIKHRI